MFNQIVELIKNSAITAVGFVVGILGHGNALVSDLPISGTQGASIVESLEVDNSIPTEDFVYQDNMTEFQNLEIQQNNVVVPIANQNPSLNNGSGSTSYLPRDEEAKSPIFIRPEENYLQATSTLLAGNNNLIIPTGVTTSLLGATSTAATTLSEIEELRPINPIKSTKTKKEVDVSLLLETDLDTFDTNLQIVDVVEDEKSYYVNYSFQTLGLENYKWSVVLKEKQIIIGRDVLGEADLGDYLSKELGEVVENEIVYLKEAQEIQAIKFAKEEAARKAAEKKASSLYSTLVGKILDNKSDDFEDYEPVVKKEELDVLVKEKDTEDPSADTESSQTTNTTGTTINTVVDNKAPVIVINGNNPALIQLNSTYSDLGAKVTDNISKNLSVQIGGDVVNTAVADSYFVEYTATDEAGNTAQATREVIVYDYNLEDSVEETVNEDSNSNTATSTNVTTSTEEVVETPIVEEIASSTSQEIIVEDSTATSTATSTDTVVSEENTPELEAPSTDITQSTSFDIYEVVDPKVEKEKEEKNNKLKNTIDATVDTVNESIDSVVESLEPVIEEAGAAVEAVSETVGEVAEEISAMIASIHFRELLGNISASLGASVVNATQGIGSFLIKIVPESEISVNNSMPANVVDVVNPFVEESSTERFIVQVKNSVDKVLNPLYGIIGSASDKAYDMFYFIMKKSPWEKTSVQSYDRLTASIVQSENQNQEDSGKIKKIGVALMQLPENVFEFFSSHRPQ
ncbi:MAG: immunoglobulin-like domain-containing protein [Patescibacteria group bacterium]